MAVSCETTADVRRGRYRISDGQEFPPGDLAAFIRMVRALPRHRFRGDGWSGLRVKVIRRLRLLLLETRGQVRLDLAKKTKEVWKPSGCRVAT